MPTIIKETNQFRLDNMEKLYVFLTDRFMQQPKPEPRKFKKYFCYFALTSTDISVKTKEVSRMFGSENHTFGMHHRDKVKDEISVYKEEKEYVDQLKKEIDGIFQKP